VSAGKHRIAVVDTGSGNLRSVEKALAVSGGDVVVSGDPAIIARADKIVVPGQGAFGGCVAGLDAQGGALRAAISERLAGGTPYLGLCLGLQILFDASDESEGCKGLGVIPGRVVRFNVPAPLKIPHMGWNPCRQGPAASTPMGTALLRGIPDGTAFYFVHSFYGVPTDPGVVALQSDHGLDFCAAVALDNVFACQFHPEKSQAAGLMLLANFVTL
jgi:imidazole glycerol-phosphate synthase subunit HisH